MQHSKPVEPDAFVDLGHDRVHRRRVAHVDARDEEMTRVEADAEPFVSSERLEDDGELLDRSADGSTRACRVLHQQPRPVVAPVQHLSQGRHDALQADVESCA